MNKLILLTGASGYVGGRLLKSLEGQGYRVRCLARRPDYLTPRVSDSTEVVRGDVLDRASLEKAMQGVHTAYYLVHSMGAREGFRETDRRAARLFGEVAREVGVRRLIYLGGLGAGGDLSEHLESRHEVGRLLAVSGVSTIELRASIIIGSGSLSFEMIRALVEKLPVMVTPRWVRVKAQPIAIEDVIAYLVEALELEGDESRVFEIGGPNRVSYLALMQEYARQRGLKRFVIPVPVLTPRLSSLWLGLVTPVYARVGRKLIDSLRNETLVMDGSAEEAFTVRPRSVREAIERALVNEDEDFAQTRWSDALSSSGESRRWGGVKHGSRIVDSRVVETMLPPSKAFPPIERIGGDTGWYYADWLWKIRGLLDLLVGGAGTRRGRRDPNVLAPGDTVDFWRVEAVEPGQFLRLVAEMKLPGRAWLQFEVQETDRGSTIRQTAIFNPDGLLGLMYWYALYPLHNLVFQGMLEAVAREGERMETPKPEALDHVA
jgi:uncharacterized protein YbjT (DUF2867 family)